MFDIFIFNLNKIIRTLSPEGATAILPYIHMYTYIHTYIHIHIYIHMHIHIHTYACTYTCTHACTYTYPCAHAHAFRRIQMHIHRLYPLAVTFEMRLKGAAGRDTSLPSMTGPHAINGANAGLYRVYIWLDNMFMHMCIWLDNIFTY